MKNEVKPTAVEESLAEIDFEIRQLGGGGEGPTDEETEIAHRLHSVSSAYDTARLLSVERERERNHAVGCHDSLVVGVQKVQAFAETLRFSPRRLEIVAGAQSIHDINCLLVFQNSIDAAAYFLETAETRIARARGNVKRAEKVAAEAKAREDQAGVELAEARKSKDLLHRRRSGELRQSRRKTLPDWD